MTTTTQPTERQIGLVPQVHESLRKATKFLEAWSVGGGVPGGTTLDGTTRWGESKAHLLLPTEIWIQPPGTPTVGELLLRAYRIAGNAEYLGAAVRVGDALARTQHKSGGWALIGDTMARQSDGSCTFDDDTTQAALRFLMHLAQEFAHAWLTRAVHLGLNHMLRAQYRDGSWPLWYPLKGGWPDYATFNDYCIKNCITTMLEAHRLYRDERYLESARRGGDFIIASQLPAPQRGWAQQYGTDMQPAWARHFEPPAVCSAVTAGCIRSLIELYEDTGDPQWLAPIPAAIDWLERSQCGTRWARFYSVGTNRPVYAEHKRIVYTREEITQERRDHYRWWGTFGIPAAIRAFEKIGEARQEGLKVLHIIEEQDDQGRWVDDREVHVETIVDKMTELLDYLEASK